MIPWMGKLPKPVDLSEEQLSQAEELRYMSWHYPYESEPVREYEAYREWECEARRLGKVPATSIEEVKMEWREVRDPLGGGLQFECVTSGLVCPSQFTLLKRNPEKS